MLVGETVCRMILWAVNDEGRVGLPLDTLSFMPVCVGGGGGLQRLNSSERVRLASVAERFSE